MSQVAALKSEIATSSRRSTILKMSKVCAREVVRKAIGSGLSKTYAKITNPSAVLLFVSLRLRFPKNHPASLPKPDVQDLQ